MKVCIIVSCFYPKISKDLLLGAERVLKKNRIKGYKKILTTGAFEIPVLISNNIKKYDGFIALGCVIKGETPHFDYICKATIDALMNLSITFKKPVGNGIITCFNKKQALKRSDPLKNNKGGEATEAVLSVLQVLKNEKR
tara:strand:+ start:351 stop:770 length:420 start_codon:yes stop_codon:yes gene_type:complete